MLASNKRFINDWTTTKASIVMHYFPNYEDPSWGQFSEVTLAGIIGKFSTLISDKTLSAKTFELSRRMAEVASKSLIADWDDVEISLPPHPHPWSFEKNIGPHPEPWKNINAAEQVEIAYFFTKFSALTTNEQFNKALKSLATEIAANAASKLADEFERCGTVPRPRPHHLELATPETMEK